MIYVEALKIQLKNRFPEFAKTVNHLPETAFIEEVAKGFKTDPVVNPTDFALKIIGMLEDGATPDGGDGAGQDQAQVQVHSGGRR